MLQFNLMTEKDIKEAASLERRRQYDEERKKRIFNPRFRLYGVDYEALEKQIAEKRFRELEEKNIEAAFIEQRRSIDKTAQILESQEKQERKRILDEINQFRLAYQRVEDRREFDLNDPEYFKKLIPPRLHDDDPRCGPSSAQKFEGEDLGENDRLKTQREQTKAWLDQQILERISAEKERKNAEEAYKAALMSRDMRALELENIEKECKQRIQEELQNYNKSLAEERELRAKLEKDQETEDGVAEMYNNLMSDMLCENPETANSNFGPGRKISTMFKGATKEDKERYRLCLLSQMEENKEKKIYEERKELEWLNATKLLNTTVASMDEELKRKKLKETKELAEENRKLWEQQRIQKLFLDKVVYTNTPTAAYYEQFNKTTR